MRRTPPPHFLWRLRQHNIAVAVAAALAAGGALLLWLLLYFAGKWALLSFAAATGRGDSGEPPFYDLGFGVVFAVVLIAALLWKWLFPSQPGAERPILGWHVVPELLLLPGSLIIAIADNLSAWLPLSRQHVQAAWEVLYAFLEQNKWKQSELGQLELASDELSRALLSLQLAGLVDFHKGQEGFFYLLRGGVEDEVRKWLQQAATPAHGS